MPEEKDATDITIKVQMDCDTESEAKPTITIAEKEGGPVRRDVPRPTITIAEKEESGDDVGIFTSPDGWVNPWDVEKKKKP